MNADHRDDDGVGETPPPVVGAVAVGTAPLPFLAVYAVIFIAHGSFHPVNPPDVTNSKGGELLAGLIALAMFMVVVLTLILFMNGRRRWPFVIMQAAALGTTIDFLFDETKGGRSFSGLVAGASLIALVLAFAPGAWTHLGRRPPRAVTLLYRRRVPMLFSGRTQG